MLIILMEHFAISKDTRFFAQTFIYYLTNVRTAVIEKTNQPFEQSDSRTQQYLGLSGFT